MAVEVRLCDEDPDFGSRISAFGGTRTSYFVRNDSPREQSPIPCEMIHAQSGRCVPRAALFGTCLDAGHQRIHVR